MALPQRIRQLYVLTNHSRVLFLTVLDMNENRNNVIRTAMTMDLPEILNQVIALLKQPKYLYIIRKTPSS